MEIKLLLNFLHFFLSELCRMTSSHTVTHTHTHPSETHTHICVTNKKKNNLLTAEVQELSHTLCPPLYECVGEKTF